MPAQSIDIASLFRCAGRIVSVTPHGTGLINETFLVTTSEARYILQRINERVFPYPRRIIANLECIARHVAGQPSIGFRLPALIPPLDATRRAVEQDGQLWRMMEFIEGARVIPRIDDPEQGRRLGQALGAFHHALHDVPLGEMTISLPGFHITPDYLARFDQVLRDHASAARDAVVDRCVREITSRRALAGVLEEPRRAGRLPERIVHGDPKIDNVLFDAAGDQVLAIIDLDTVQPGFIHHDIGDCLRSCCNRHGEGATDPAKIRFDIDICRAVLEGYAGWMRDVLTAPEIEQLYGGIRLIPYELGIRFLTDYLEGNRWFRVDYPRQNLDKALIQLALVAAIETRKQQIKAIIERCF